MSLAGVLRAKDGAAIISGLQHTGPIGGGYPNVVSWDPNVVDKLYYGADIGGPGYSIDGGKSVIAAASGIGYEDSHAKIACINAVDAGGGATIVVAGTGFKGVGGEVISSTDGLNSWTVDSTDISFSAQNSDSPLPTGRPRSTDPSLILRLANGDWLAGTYDAGLWLSTDSRATWTNLNLFTGVVHIRCMALDPDDSSAVYVGLWGDDVGIPNKGLWHITNLGGAPAANQVNGLPDVVESISTLGDRIYLACGVFGVRRYAPNASGSSGGYSYDGGVGGTTGVVNEPHVSDLDGFRDLVLEVELSKADWTADSEIIRQWNTGDTNEQSIRFRITGGVLQWRIRAADGSLFSYDMSGWTPPANGATATLRIENRNDGTGEFFQDSNSVDIWSHDIDSAGQASSTTIRGLEIGGSGDTVYSASITTDLSASGSVITDTTGAIGTSKMSTSIDGVAGASNSDDMLIVGTAEGQGEVWLSNTGGASWTNTTAIGVNINPWGSSDPVMAFSDHSNWALNEVQCDIACVAISPHDSNKWAVCSTSALWSTDDAGATWRPMNGYQIMSYRDASISPSGVIAVGNVDHDVVYSTDNGQSWGSFGVGGVTVTHGLTWSPNGSELAYANNERDNNTTGAECYVTTTLGVTGTDTGWSSTSAGASGKRIVGIGWTTLGGGDDRLIAAVDDGGVWTIDRNAGAWASWTLQTTALMGAQSNNGLRCSVEVNGASAFIYDREDGVWRSNDYGVTWTRLWQNSVPSGGNLGYLAYDAVNDRLYVSSDSGLHRIDSASTAGIGAQVDLNPGFSPSPIAFDNDRLWAIALPTGAGNPAPRLFYSDDPDQASPTFAEHVDVTLQRVSPEISDMAVANNKVVITNRGKGLLVGSI